MVLPLKLIPRFCTKLSIGIVDLIFFFTVLSVFPKMTGFIRIYIYAVNAYFESNKVIIKFT